MKLKAVLSIASTITLAVLALSSPAKAKPKAKPASKPFDVGLAEYMASNCAAAMAPLYQASLEEGEFKDRAHLYLAHCQSVLERPADAAYNLDQIDSDHLLKPDRKLYRDLMTKHQAAVAALHKLYFNLTPYAGSGSHSPDSVKGTSQFFGLSAGVSRPLWSVSAFYESFAQELTPASYKDYTQSMSGAQLGYFILPQWRVSASYTNIRASSDQLKSVNIVGAQTDVYFAPSWSVFAEYYQSAYPNLLPNVSGQYKYAVTAGQYVVGLGFPLLRGTTYGLSGSASYSGVQLHKSGDAAAIIDSNLSKDTSRFEAGVSTYVSRFNASLSYWGGNEVLGVRSRGSVIMNSTELHKGGGKLGVGYNFTDYFGANLSCGMESYTGVDVSGAHKDFSSATVTGSASFNW